MLDQMTRQKRKGLDCIVANCVFFNMNGGEGVVWGHFLVVGNARATVILSAAKDLAKPLAE